MPRPYHSSRFDHPKIIGWILEKIKLFNMYFSSLSSYLVPPILILFSNTLSLVPPSMWETKFHTHTKQRTKNYLCIS
jgi:hypothetical protein